LAPEATKFGELTQNNNNHNLCLL